jgi:hypothetical protein
MEQLRLAFYVIMAVSAFLCLAVLLSEFWKFTKLIPFLLIRAALKIRSLFLRPVPIQSKQTDSQFTGTLTLSDITLEKETVPHSSVKQSFNRSEFARSRKRINGRFA